MMKVNGKKAYKRRLIAKTAQLGSRSTAVETAVFAAEEKERAKNQQKREAY